jgi:hypothetical protein
MHKKYEILIARHEEKLNWLDFLPDKKNRTYNVIISNSGEEINQISADSIVACENLGREAGHYLRHIINNYDNLSDCVVFLQGNPWPHALPNHILELFYGDPEFKFDMSFIGTDQPATTPNIHRWSEAEYIIKSGWGERKQPEPKNNSGIPWVIGGGAQFYVKKEIIHKRPKDHYQRILECAKDPDSKFAHVLEFHWPNIFDLGDI